MDIDQFLICCFYVAIGLCGIGLIDQFVRLMMELAAQYPGGDCISRRPFIAVALDDHEKTASRTCPEFSL